MGYGYGLPVGPGCYGWEKSCGLQPETPCFACGQTLGGCPPNTLFWVLAAALGVGLAYAYGRHAKR